MNTHPVINALLAALYIALIATVLFYGVEGFFGGPSILIPITMISLFTLSAAVMGYLFLSRPLVLLFEGKKEEAVKIFLQTILAFAAIVAIFLLAVFVLGKPTPLFVI